MTTTTIKNLTNLTPHAVTMLLDNNQQIIIPPSGQLARVTSHTVAVGEVLCDGKKIPVTGTSYGEVEGLPAPSEGTIYIVSSLVASRCKERTDVFIPNESVRDDQGRIIGCRSLGRV